MKTILLNRKKCIGCAICADVYPDIFSMDEEDGKASLTGQKKLVDIQKIRYPVDDDVAQVVDKCVVDAIHIV